MKTLILMFVGLTLCSFTPALADVVYVCGDVSGVWSADTVLVTCEVRVPPGDTLIIEPGVKVVFWAYCKFIVDSGAVLHAVGTAIDSILFDERPFSASRHENRWNGLRFLSASNSSRLEYCHLKHGLATGSGEDANGGAIYCNSSSPTIRNCLIDSCSASNGGGIYCTSSSPVIDSTTIRGNSAGYYGGGIYCSSSNPTISGNTISGNSATYNGGGIFCYQSNPAISDNTISGNSGPTYGGGIGCNYSSPTINGNTVSGNSASLGGGISCDESNPIISGNTISGNSAAVGGGIHCYHSSATISGNTISGNSAGTGGGIYCLSGSNPTISGNTISENSAGSDGGGIYCYNNSSPTISGNTISGNSASNGGGIFCESNSNPPMQLNEISQNTASGDGGGIYLGSASPTMNKNTIVDNTAATGGGLYCTGSSPVLRNCILWGNSQMIYQVSGSNAQVSYSDCQSFWPGTGNIFDDPQFVNPGASDYHLLCSSPCIDSGDPNPVYNDPDGTRADMGCYYFQGWTSLPVLVTWMDEDSLRLAWHPSCPTASSYNVLYASEPSPALWSPLVTTTDTTTTDQTGLTGKRFYCVRTVR